MNLAHRLRLSQTIKSIVVIDEHFLTTLTRKAIDYCLVAGVRAHTMETTLRRILGELSPHNTVGPRLHVGVFAKEKIVKKRIAVIMALGESYCWNSALGIKSRRGRLMR